MINIIVSLLLILNRPIFAAEASPSANNPEEIQQIREVVQQKVKEKLNLISTPSDKPKSIFGTIEKINDNQINTNWNNNSNTITTNDDTIIIGSKRNKLSLKDLKTGQDILSMGYFNAQNQLEAKRIVVIEIKNLENKTQVINGQIVDVSQTSPVFTVIPNKNKNSQFQITTNNTNIKKLKSGQKIIAVVKPDAKINNTFDLLKIVSLSESSPSATPTPQQQ